MYRCCCCFYFSLRVSLFLTWIIYKCLLLLLRRLLYRMCLCIFLFFLYFSQFFTHAHIVHLSLSLSHIHSVSAVNFALIFRIFFYAYSIFFSLHLSSYSFFYIFCFHWYIFFISLFVTVDCVFLFDAYTRVNTRTLTETQIWREKNCYKQNNNREKSLGFPLFPCYCVYFLSLFLCIEFDVCCCCFSLTVFTYKLHSNFEGAHNLSQRNRRDKSGYESAERNRRKKCSCVYNNNRHTNSKQHT